MNENIIKVNHDELLTLEADIALVSLYPNEESDTLDSVSVGLNLKLFSKEGSYLSITGYPNSKSNQQWTHCNSIDYSQTDNEEYHKLFCDIDTSVGQSGSPIINSHRTRDRNNHQFLDKRSRHYLVSA